MYVYALIEKKKLCLLDDHDFVLDESHSEKLLSVWTYKADCRDEAIAQIQANWQIMSDHYGYVAKSNGTIDTAIFDLKTISHGRIIFYDPKEKERYEHQLEYVIKQVSLR